MHSSLVSLAEVRVEWTCDLIQISTWLWLMNMTLQLQSSVRYQHHDNECHHVISLRQLTPVYDSSESGNSSQFTCHSLVTQFTHHAARWQLYHSVIWVVNVSLHHLAHGLLDLAHGLAHIITLSRWITLTQPCHLGQQGAPLASETPDSPAAWGT